MMVENGSTVHVGNAALRPDTEGRAKNGEGLAA